MLWKMAWRNIWRNKRRTLFLLTGVAMGLAGILFIKGFVNGWIFSLVNHAAECREGHVRVMTCGYFQNPAIEYSMDPSPGLRQFLAGDARVRTWAERVTAPGMLCGASHSATVSLVGIDPGQEAGMLGAATVMREGRFLRAGDRSGIMISQRLGKKFKARLNAKLLVMAQKADGDIATAACRVLGFFETGNTSFDDRAILADRADLQAMLGLDGKITEVVLLLRNTIDNRAVAADINGGIVTGTAKAYTWEEQLPRAVGSIELAWEFIIPLFAMVYLAMAFGILNTLLMALAERTYEIGVMLSVGLSRSRLLVLIMLESFFIAVIGVAAGMIAGWATVECYHSYGMNLSRFSDATNLVGVDRMVYPFLKPGDLTIAAVATFTAAMLFSVLPAVWAVQTTPVKALRRAG